MHRQLPHAGALDELLTVRRSRGLMAGTPKRGKRGAAWCLGRRDPWTRGIAALALNMSTTASSNDAANSIKLLHSLAAQV